MSSAVNTPFLWLGYQVTDRLSVWGVATTGGAGQAQP